MPPVAARRGSLRRPGSPVGTLRAIDRAGASDEVTKRGAGFADVFDQYATEVYRFVHRRCRDHALAEDVSQDTFLAAMRAFDDPSEVTPAWLIRVARNRLLDVLRRETRYTRKLRLIGVPDERSDHSPLVAERLRVQAALELLPVGHRVALMLHYVDGMTIGDLADELGRSPKAVESLMTRARRRFRQELGSDD